MSEATVLARPYAKAVFETAQETSQLPQWQQVLQILAAIIAEADVKAIIKNPLVDDGRIAEMLLAVSTEVLGAPVSDAQQNLVNLLASYDRLAVLPELAEAYEKLLAEHNKTLDVEITSSFALDEGQKQRLCIALEKRFGCKIAADYYIDDNLIGGLTVKVGDNIIDGSVTGKVKRLMSHLKIKERVCK